MPRPLIGITMDADETPGRSRIYSDYAASVEKAGGMPVGIPHTLEHGLIVDLLGRIDGILFSGGNDIDPVHWGEPRHPQAVPLDGQRERLELALVAEVEKRRLPALGVCLGAQIMNVHRGGTLHQFLPEVPRPEPIEHRRLDREWPRHPVRLEADSILARAIGKTEFQANTYHKQSIKQIGRGLRVVGHAPDGVIEAFEDASLPLFVAVQWHPERMSDEPEHRAIFDLLVRAAAQHRP